jgi:hypothetical protein
VFYICGGPNTVIEGLTITGGGSEIQGGGLYPSGDFGIVLIAGSTFSNNTASVCYGGGIDIDGNYNDVLIANTTITGNSAVSGGGFHVDSNNDTVVAQSTIVGNTATSTDALFGGGGIHFDEDIYELSLSGTIVSGNSAVAGAADISVGADPVLSTMDANDSLLGEVDGRITVTGAGNVNSTTPGLRRCSYSRVTISTGAAPAIRGSSATRSTSVHSSLRVSLPIPRPHRPRPPVNPWCLPSPVDPLTGSPETPGVSPCRKHL